MKSSPVSCTQLTSHWMPFSSIQSLAVQDLLGVEPRRVAVVELVARQLDGLPDRARRRAAPVVIGGLEGDVVAPAAT